MIFRSIAWSILLLFALASCQRSTDLNDVQRATVIQDVQQMTVQFFDDLRTHNADAAISRLDDSDAFYWVFPPDTAHVSRAAVAAQIRADLQANPSIEVRWLQMRVEPVTSTAAVYSGVFESVSTDPAGATVTVRGTEHAVVILRDDGWKFMNGQTTLEER